MRPCLTGRRQKQTRKHPYAWEGAFQQQKDRLACPMYLYSGTYFRLHGDVRNEQDWRCSTCQQDHRIQEEVGLRVHLRKPWGQKKRPFGRQGQRQQPKQGGRQRWQSSWLNCFRSRVRKVRDSTPAAVGHSLCCPRFTTAGRFHWIPNSNLKLYLLRDENIRFVNQSLSKSQRGQTWASCQFLILCLSIKAT